MRSVAGARPLGIDFYADGLSALIGALFLSVGVVQGASRDRQQLGLVLVGLLVPALALAGAPLTGGAAAKLALKSTAVTLPAPWPEWLDGLLPLAALGTTLLMGRFLWVIWPFLKTDGAHLRLGLWLPWALLVIVVAVSPWLLAPAVTTVRRTATFAALWPVVVGALLSFGAWWWGRKADLRVGLRIPAGDLLILAPWLVAHVRQWWQVHGAAALRQWRPFLCFGDYYGRIGRKVLASLRACIVQTEGRLGGWAAVSFLFLLLVVTLFLFLAMT